MSRPALLVAVLVVLGAATAYQYRSDAPGKDAVLMRDIDTLTLRAGAMTTGRRTSPVPQLVCVGGGACGRTREPKIVQCQRVGHDGSSYQWRCEAELDDTVRLGEVTVGCEGYRHPDDEYVLRGSCGLEYELEYTGSGNRYTFDYGSRLGGGGGGSGGFSSLLWFAIIAVICIGVWRSCVDRPAGAYGSSYGGGNYGSSYGGGNYGAYPDPASCPPGTVPPYPTYTSYAPQTGGGWWTGAATGGLLGYLFGRNRNPGYTYGYNSGYRSGFSSYSSGSRSSSRPSGSRRSVGVGGTRNR